MAVDTTQNTASGQVQASVIIPAYNGECHLEEQLLALARQRTELPWELIVADNGSTDATLEIVERVLPQFNVSVRVVDATARRGTAAARNIGAAAAKSELLLFTDQDDVVDELWVQEMVTALHAHECVVGSIDVSRLNRPEIEAWRPPLDGKTAPLFGGRPWAFGPNSGFRAATFAQLNGYCELYQGGGEDLDISLRMHASGISTFQVEGALLHYRYRDDIRATIRQYWGYGRAWGPLYRTHGLKPSTFLDVLLMCFRSAKQAFRDLCHGRRPVCSAVSMAHVFGEASRFWWDASFWQPVCRYARPENPIRVQRARLARLAHFIGPRSR